MEFYDRQIMPRVINPLWRNITAFTVWGEATVKAA